MDKKPDIMIFMSDQHSPLFHRDAGGLVDTPNFNSLAEHGTRFTEAYTSCPLCVPARMSMLAARYGSNIDVLTNDDTLQDTTPTFLHSLAAEGYETVLIGRMHFTGKDQRHGFTRRLFGDVTPVTWNKPEQKLREERGVYFLTFRDTNCTDVSGGGESPVLWYDEGVVENALAYLQEKHDKPQCIVVGTYGPHFPYVAPPELYKKYRDTVTLPRFFNRDIPYMTDWIRTRQKAITEETALHCLAAYCGMVEETDRHIGTLFRAFENFTAQRNAEKMFVYISDHGDQAGERNIYGKQTFFEKSAKIPFIVHGDRIPQNLEIKTPVSILDLGPTVCDFTGARPLPRQDGISLMPYLDNPGAGKERAVVSEVVPADPEGIVFGRMVRYGRFKFITYFKSEAQDILFDLAADPGETKNIILDNPKIAEHCRKILAGMKSPAEVVSVQTARKMEIKLLADWEKAAGGDDSERWSGNPPTARSEPRVI